MQGSQYTPSIKQSCTLRTITIVCPALISAAAPGAIRCIDGTSAQATRDGGGVLAGPMGALGMFALPTEKHQMFTASKCRQVILGAECCERLSMTHLSSVSC